MHSIYVTIYLLRDLVKKQLVVTLHRQLEGEIADEWAIRTDKDELLPLVESIIKFDMKHNAEIQACDLLMEIDRLDLLETHMDETNYPRVCLYLVK